MPCKAASKDNNNAYRVFINELNGILGVHNIVIACFDWDETAFHIKVPR